MKIFFCLKQLYDKRHLAFYLQKKMERNMNIQIVICDNFDTKSALDIVDCLVPYTYIYV